MITTRKAPPIAVRQPILIEAGPRFLRRTDLIEGANELVATTREEHGLELELLIYDREGSLAHTNNNLGGRYPVTVRTIDLCHSLNEAGLPFNLALNGSPNPREHVPFDRKEVRYLEQLQESGFKAGVRNVVTVADNTLVEDCTGDETTLRRDFPELDVIASCISVVFEPNLQAFRASSGLEYNDPNFLTGYYSYLYSFYDQVVPKNQLANPAFLSAVRENVSDLSDRTIVFLNFGCGSPQLGQCVNDYGRGVRSVRPNMPVIPDRFMSKTEDGRTFVDPSPCKQAHHSLELMNRFRDLRALLEMGIHQFKIPARLGGAHEDLDFLCRFINSDQGSETFPTEPMVTGNRPADIKLSFISNYPEVVHSLLRGFHWPSSNIVCGGAGYDEQTVEEIGRDLHDRAVKVFEGASA